MSRSPAAQFYFADYLRDTRTLSIQARGAWMDVLCIMWFSQEKGRCNADVTQMKRLWGVENEAAEAILEELIASKICDVERDCNGNVTLINRRMVRDEKERQSTKDRVKRFREKKSNAECNADVTGMKRKCNTASSSSLKENTLVVSGANNGCPHQEIISLYHELCPTLPRVRQWTPKRQKQLRARWLSSKDYQDTEWWREFFKYIAGKCPHLTGKNDRQWTADLEWICKEENFVKIVEGRYEK